MKIRPFLFTALMLISLTGCVSPYRSVEQSRLFDWSYPYAVTNSTDSFTVSIENARTKAAAFFAAKQHYAKAHRTNIDNVRTFPDMTNNVYGVELCDIETNTTPREFYLISNFNDLPWQGRWRFSSDQGGIWTGELERSWHTGKEHQEPWEKIPGFPSMNGLVICQHEGQDGGSLYLFPIRQGKLDGRVYWVGRGGWRGYAGFRNGVNHGKSKTWDENGVLQSTGLHVDGNQVEQWSRPKK